MRTLFAAGLIALVVPACIVGPGEISGVGEEQGGEGGGGEGGGGGDGTGSGGGGSTATPRIQASVDKATIASELGKTETLVLTLTSMDGFTGSVPVQSAMMDATTALQGFTVTATPATATLTAGGTATVNIEIKIPTNPDVLTPQLKLDLGGAAPMTVTSDLTIQNRYVFTIPAGTGTGAHNNIPSNAPIRLKSGAELVFHNSDSIQHVIHGDMGVPHENTAQGEPNGDYTITATNDGTWYCHTHGADSANVRIVNVE